MPQAEEPQSDDEDSSKEEDGEEDDEDDEDDVSQDEKEDDDRSSLDTNEDDEDGDDDEDGESEDDEEDESGVPLNIWHALVFFSKCCCDTQCSSAPVIPSSKETIQETSPVRCERGPNSFHQVCSFSHYLNLQCWVSDRSLCVPLDLLGNIPVLA